MRQECGVEATELRHGVMVQRGLQSGGKQQLRHTDLSDGVTRRPVRAVCIGLSFAAQLIRITPFAVQDHTAEAHRENRQQEYEVQSRYSKVHSNGGAAGDVILKLPMASGMAGSAAEKGLVMTLDGGGDMGRCPTWHHFASE